MDDHDSVTDVYEDTGSLMDETDSGISSMDSEETSGSVRVTSTNYVFQQKGGREYS
jgi:hypothetical protein